MTGITPGQAAYEGYRAYSRGKSLISGQPIPGWEVLEDDLVRAWEAAAQAVADEYVHRRRSGTPYITVIDTNSRRWCYIADAWLVKDGRLIVQSGEPEGVRAVAEFTAWTGVNHSNDEVVIEYSHEP